MPDADVLIDINRIDLVDGDVGVERTLTVQGATEMQGAVRTIGELLSEGVLRAEDTVEVRSRLDVMRQGRMVTRVQQDIHLLDGDVWLCDGDVMFRVSEESGFRGLIDLVLELEQRIATLESA
jgi:hypothetical protein